MTGAQAADAASTPYEDYAVVMLHGLGGSARSFDAVAAHLPDRARPFPIDLPGFGAAAQDAACDVSAAADHVLARIAAGVRGRWLLVGHSMGGKIAAVVAHRILVDGAPLFGLAGLVLLSPSPVSPEPMPPEKRGTMSGWVTDGPVSRAHARTFVEDNVATALPPDAYERAVADVQRSSPEAWRAWLDRGSREDWAPDTVPLDLPSVVLGGTDDPDLGADAQRRLTLPHFPRARLTSLPHTGHLLPLERPQDVAEAISNLWDDVQETPPVPSDFAAVLASPRVSARTRAALARRALADDPHYEPRVLSPAQLRVLRVVAAAVVPQDRGAVIDLAARVDAYLDGGLGDGWRPAGSPPDDEAYRHALDVLADLPELSGAQVEQRLTELANGEATPATGARLSATQLAAWFTDAAADLTRQWVAHPATMARIGFDGIANGGDGPRKQGWIEVRAGRRETWEPAMSGVRR